ncbi:MAG: hypothetical protein GX146_05175 [Myxococcales bacterium]|nr:hypothetical protein [Myxococcales bacterium]
MPQNDKSPHPSAMNPAAPPTPAHSRLRSSTGALLLSLLCALPAAAQPNAAETPSAALFFFGAPSDPHLQRAAEVITAHLTDVTVALHFAQLSSDDALRVHSVATDILRDQNAAAALWCDDDGALCLLAPEIHAEPACFGDAATLRTVAGMEMAALRVRSTVLSLLYDGALPIPTDSHDDTPAPDTASPHAAAAPDTASSPEPDARAAPPGTTDAPNAPLATDAPRPAPVTPPFFFGTHLRGFFTWPAQADATLPALSLGVDAYFARFLFASLGADWLRRQRIDFNLHRFKISRWPLHLRLGVWHDIGRWHLAGSLGGLLQFSRLHVSDFRPNDKAPTQLRTAFAIALAAEVAFRLNRHLYLGVDGGIDIFPKPNQHPLNPRTALRFNRVQPHIGLHLRFRFPQ